MPCSLNPLSEYQSNSIINVARRLPQEDEDAAPKASGPRAGRPAAKAAVPAAAKAAAGPKRAAARKNTIAAVAAAAKAE